MSQNRMVRTILVCLWSALVLQGCGFELRGKAALPQGMDRTYVDADRGAKNLARQLERLLEGNGVTIVPSAEEGSATLQIIRERLLREVQSVGATARVREFALEYRVAYRVLDHAGEVLVAERELLLRRDYTFDQNQVLGTTSEEELIERELQREMALRIVANLGAG